MHNLVQRMRAGDRSALARLLTQVEQGGEATAQVLEAVYPHTGHAYVIGITGPPGAGKSSLADQLTGHYRAQGQTVAILAVDPTSPFTGGAFLGDRIRMQRHYLDSGVFIRSMATRGGTGGLSRMARCAVRVLDAAGADMVLLETVGVGQTELEVLGAADTVVVVLVPEAGDAIQTLKAGLLEVADILVVNKADREGANRLVTYLSATLNMAPPASGWRPPVLQTQAHKGEGVDILAQTIQQHRQVLEASSQLQGRRRQHQRQEFLQVLHEGLQDLLRRLEARDGATATALSRVEQGEVDPYVAAWGLLRSGALLREWLQALEEEQGHKAV